jgi:hypothetical protein
MHELLLPAHPWMFSRCLPHFVIGLCSDNTLDHDRLKRRHSAPARPFTAHNALSLLQSRYIRVLDSTTQLNIVASAHWSGNLIVERFDRLLHRTTPPIDFLLVHEAGLELAFGEIFRDCLHTTAARALTSCCLSDSRPLAVSSTTSAVVAVALCKSRSLPVGAAVVRIQA